MSAKRLEEHMRSSLHDFVSLSGLLRQCKLTICAWSRSLRVSERGAHGSISGNLVLARASGYARRKESAGDDYKNKSHLEFPLDVNDGEKLQWIYGYGK